MAQKLLGAIVACLPTEENICVYPWESTRSEDQPLHPKTKDIIVDYSVRYNSGYTEYKRGLFNIDRDEETP